jgi:fructose-specific phosphotransferase system IIC component
MIPAVLRLFDTPMLIPLVGVLIVGFFVWELTVVVRERRRAMNERIRRDSESD